MAGKFAFQKLEMTTKVSRFELHFIIGILNSSEGRIYKQVIL